MRGCTAAEAPRQQEREQVGTVAAGTEALVQEGADSTEEQRRALGQAAAGTAAGWGRRRGAELEQQRQAGAEARAGTVAAWLEEAG